MKRRFLEVCRRDESPGGEMRVNFRCQEKEKLRGGGGEKHGPEMADDADAE